MNRIGRLIQAGNWDELVEETIQRFQIPVTSNEIKTAIEPRKSPVIGLTWSEGTWWMWIKSRMEEAGMFRYAGKQSFESPDGWGVTLHVGFVSIEENEEHLRNLRTYLPFEPSRVARSKIIRSLPFGWVRPIDRTAARVARDDS
jgi:hypothetical protein